LVSPPELPVALLLGASIGFWSGLTGVRGGILITPLLLYRRWADPKSAAAVSAVFILINSMVALVGHLESAACLPVGLPFFAVAVVIGRGTGSQLGRVYLSANAIYRILGAVMFIAGGYKTHFCLNCRINAKPVRFIDCFTP